jgi:cell division transport system permease protein
LFRASLHGLLAGMIASGLLIALISFANKRIEDLTLIQNNDRIALLLGCLLVIGILVGTTSTYRAVRKYLKLSLDELY